eukprot:25205_1
MQHFMSLLNTQKQEWACVLCTYLNKPNRKDCEMCGTSKDHPPPQKKTYDTFFQREMTNKKISYNNATGMIREIKIVDQFKDQKLKTLINEYNTCTAICGYLSCAIPQYLLSNYEFPFNKTYRNITDAQDEKHENGYDKIVKKLCDSNELNAYVSTAMHFIITDRIKYIQKNKNKFKKAKDETDYKKAWVANYEISKYIQTMDCKNKKYIAFLRCNQFREIDIANREEKELIEKEEKPFGKNVRFLIELFEPRILIQCDNNYNGFIQECKKRNIEPQQLLWILDLHGHYNTAFATQVNNVDNVIIMDTYLANHCSNPAALKCFHLVFNGDNMDVIKCICGAKMEYIQA